MFVMKTLLLILGLVADTITAFQNPIISGFNPDPSVIRVENDFFLATSTFEFFPGVPIYHSTDLVSWTCLGHALNRPSQLNLRGTAPSGGIFAPTLRFNNGTYYLITTAFHVISPPDNTTSLPRSFYVTTTDIWDETSWSDPTYVDQPGFDPDLFFDDDGRVYLTTTQPEFIESGNFANWITEIDIKTGNSLTSSRLFHTTTVPEEDGYPLTEGSHLYKLNGTYYMLTADSGTSYDHKATIHRSTYLEGPWESNPDNPILWNGRDLSHPIQSTGHADLVTDTSGNWFIVFLATRPQNPANTTGYNQLGRETFLAPVTWNCDGWPVVNSGLPITETISTTLVPERPFPDEEPIKYWRDTFTTDLVDKEYYTLTTPYKPFHSILPSGHLRLHGNPYTLSARECPAALLRKQKSVTQTFSATLSSFSPSSIRQEAGATIYLSIHYHNEIAITAHPETGERLIVTHIRSGPDATLNTTYISNPAVAAGEDAVIFYIRARPEQYELGYSTVSPIDRLDSEGPFTMESEISYVASVENKWLQTYVDGWQNFVGAHFGIYNTGTALPTLEPADFDQIMVEPN